MFFNLLSYWDTFVIALAAVIVLLSFEPAEWRHLAAAICFTIISAGMAGLIFTTLLFWTSFARSAPGSVHEWSALDYLYPTFTLILTAFPAVALYPRAGRKRWRSATLVLFGVTLLGAMGYSVLSASTFGGRVRYDQNLWLVLCLLLWLRVDDMRAGLAARTDELT
jgi:hypothetical protein